MFRNNFFLIMFGLAVLSIAGCEKQEFKQPESAVNIQPAKILYTQFSLFQEDNNFRTTNYRRGTLIPINTAVTLQDKNTDEAKLALVDSGQTLTIENVPKFTKDDMTTALGKIIKTSKVDLNQFSQMEKRAILVGRVQIGMSKKAVLAAIGYPPQHQTPSLNGDTWTYWSSRTNRFAVIFKQDKVDHIVD